MSATGLAEALISSGRRRHPAHFQRV